MTLQEKLKAIDKLSTAVNDKNGRKVMGRLSQDAEIRDRLKINYIPTPSQNVNNALGGGFPRKRMTIVSGLPDSGKTSILLESIGYNMQMDQLYS